jgi:hypothetical protein
MAFAALTFFHFNAPSALPSPSLKSLHSSDRVVIAALFVRP